jgi:hypothetical protein
MGVPNIGNRAEYDNNDIMPLIMYENNEKNTIYK